MTFNGQKRWRCRGALRVATFALLFALFVAPWSGGSAAEDARVVYTPPKNAVYQPLHNRLKAERWLERMEGVVRMFRLPQPLTLKLENCDGNVDAWFIHRTVAVCYEYLHVPVRRIEARALPSWLTAEEALAGAFVDAFLHEFGHALVEHLRLPVLGREEEAADHIAAFLMLHLAGEEAAGLIRGTAHVYMSWMAFFAGRPSGLLANGASRAETRAHPTAAQRLYNLVCIALGSDPERYRALADAVEMPADRGEDCAGEYRQLRLAYDSLLRRHVNPAGEQRARQEIRYFARLR